MLNLRTPEEASVEDWIDFKHGGVRALRGFGEASAEELIEAGWSVERDSPIFELDYRGRRQDAEESEAAVGAELDRLQERSCQKREGLE